MSMPRTAKAQYRLDLHAKITAAAASGKLVAYSDLGTSRAMVGN
jgi:maltooligosyltrehalose synthase